MKMTIKYIAALFAAGALLASCTDEAFENQNISNPQSEGTRVIAVSFGQQTRTALGDDGLTPEFVGGESVLVSNDETVENCTVTISGEKTIITTSLKGDLTAVYPARAAKVIKSEKTGGKIIDPDDVLISTNQSGTFADANICMARMKDGEEKMTFHNKTAILKFYVDNSIGVYNLKVKSSDAEIAENSQEITIESKSGSLYEDMPDNQDKRICYVAVKSGVDAGTLMFISHTTTQGCVRKSSPATGVTLEVGTMYNAFIPYYVQVGDQKWAYCNIGAFLPEENGHYFSWGNIERYVFDVKWKTSPDFPGAGTVLEGGFSEENYTKTSGYSLNTDIPTNATYDAAATFWGDKWRMPTKDEFKTLYSSCGGTGSTQVPTSLGTVPTKDKGIYWCTNYNGKTGLLMVNANQEQLFFPAAGYGYNAPLHGAGAESIYWSSTISNTAAQAYTLHSDNREVVPAHSDGRHICLPIRPIYDEPAPVPNVFTVNEEGKRIEFTKGNLYWNGSAWALEANQYDYRTWKGYPACINGEKITSATQTGTGLLCWTIDAKHSYAQTISSKTNLCGSGKETVPFFHESKNFSVGEQQGLYVLSQTEWDYLLNRRTTLDRSASKINNKDDARYMWCKVLLDETNSVPGLMIFPDYFTWPTGDGTPAQPDVTHINNGNLSQSSFSEFTKDEFAKVVNEGAIFLPFSGWRWPPQYGTNIDIRNVDNEFLYWSSTADEGIRAVRIYYNSAKFQISPSDRDHAFPIRLVKNYSATEE